MSAVSRAVAALRDLELQLRRSSPACVDPVALADRVHAVRTLLSGEGARWIGTTEAKRLLSVGSENTVKAWARLGLLRSRTLPNGRTQVLLDDVLERRAETEDLAAIGGEELAPEELRMLRETRPGKKPWEREGVELAVRPYHRVPRPGAARRQLSPAGVGHEDATGHRLERPAAAGLARRGDLGE